MTEVPDEGEEKTIEVLKQLKNNKQLK